jgi:hypothetical protein
MATKLVFSSPSVITTQSTPRSAVLPIPSCRTPLAPYEDKSAPRNVTMNVKDLPDDHNTTLISRHPQLPEGINKAAAIAATAHPQGEQLSLPTLTGSTASSDGASNFKPKHLESNDMEHNTSNQMEIFQRNSDGKPKCGVCGKVFQKSSHLRLHVNIHYFESQNR